MSIDWSKAPEGATHWDPVDENWLREFGGKAFNWSSSTKRWVTKGWQYPDDLSIMPRLMQRPPVQPWAGECLPPVGTVCEFKSVGHHSEPEYQWCIYHGRMSCGGYIVEFHHHTSPTMTTCAPFDPGLTYFRPVRTPEQIAAEKRIEEINEMAELSLYGHYAITLAQAKIACAVLHDKGYRKVTP